MKKGTESRHPDTMKLDQMSMYEIAQLMNQEDLTVPKAINEELDIIEKVIEVVVAQLKNGGRLFYIGAGTSGRLGVLDAVECVPTFGTSPELIQGIMAGGNKAIVEAVEGIEDSGEQAVKDLKKKQLSNKDVVIGIAASGRTPYVAEGLNYANEIGAQTASIVNNKDTKIGKVAKYSIEILTGPEILTGSTRLKAGTSAKLVLNMISTISMVQLGKTFENLMVDVKATNNKLIDRSKRIVVEATGVDYEKAEQVLKNAGSVKLAIVMILSGRSKIEAESSLEKAHGIVKDALEQMSP